MIEKQVKEERPLRVAIASDLHLMSSALLKNEGSAFQRVIDADRKLLKESRAIMDQFIEEMLRLSPDLLLLPGDLTKDGEELSHLRMAEDLERLAQAGIRSCVIPGNHDINNPHARYYDGDAYLPAAHVSPDRFAEIYRPFGYDPQTLVSRGPGLSYATEALPGVWVVGLDSCIYDHNFENNYPTTEGQLTDDTLEWVKEVMAQSRALKKQVLVMTHHNVLEHFPFQSYIAREYVVKDWVRAADRLASAGIEVIFTGHFHAQNVVGKCFSEGHLYDVETGSIVTYPCPFRMVELYPDRLEISSQLLSLSPEQLGGLSLQEYAYRHLEEGIPGLGQYLANYVRLKYPDLLSEDKANLILSLLPAFRPLIMDIYTGHLAGDATGLRYQPDPDKVDTQPMSGDLLQQLKQLAKGINPKYAPLFQVLEGILHSDTTGDNQLTIPLTVQHG
ncbi:MAG: metallophosphoesterase [Porphyromonas sp.]|nr:metallophosphoesterase [Porphyromonas sp.]